MMREAPNQNNILALEVLSQLGRSWWTFVVGPCIGLTLAIVAMQYIPKVYEASTKVLVAPQKIPQEYVRSTITDDMGLRLAALKEAVLSRPYMMFLIQGTVNHPVTETEAELLMREFRERVEIDVAHGYFEIKYRDRSPEHAARVVNMLADRYISENAQYRTQRAEDTTETLQTFASDALAQLNAQEQRISQYRAAHLYETAEHLPANLQLLEGRRQDLLENEAAITAAKDRLEGLKDQLTQAAQMTPASGAAAEATPDPLVARIRRLEQELETARSRYKEDHPDVKTKKRELDELLTTSGSTEIGEDGTTVNRVRSPLMGQIQGAERDLERLNLERERIRGEIDLYSRRIEATPMVEQKVSELTKGYDNAQAQFKDYQTKASAARGAQKMEESQKGEQFEVIERAVPPVLPVRPIPILVYAIGFIVGLCATVGPRLLRLMLDPLICSERRLHLISNVPVLVVVPRIGGAQTSRADRRLRTRNFAYSLLSIAALAVAVVAKLLPRVTL